MRRVLALAAIGAIGMIGGAGAACAHGPMRLKLELDQKLDATPDEVWEVVGRFDDMGWHPAVASTEVTGDGSVDQPDHSTRVLHLKSASGDAVVAETLSKWQPDRRCIGWRIDKVETSVLPVTNYASTLCVRDEGGKAMVTWKAGFYRGYPNNEPPEDLNDEAANRAVGAAYQAGLDALAERFGKAE
jgi:hypothetical protein